MKVVKLKKGDIFSIEDQSRKGTTHNYILLTSIDAQNTVQAMSITSMYNKDLKNYEIPIILSNGYISYIMTNRIYTFESIDISMNSYKGSIKDDEGFIEMLIDCYRSNLFHDKKYCEESVMKYIEEFESESEGHEEYRSNKSHDGSLGHSYDIKETLLTIKEEMGQMKTKVGTIKGCDYGNIVIPTPIQNKKVTKKSKLLERKDLEKIKSFDSFPYHIKNFSDDELDMILSIYRKYCSSVVVKNGERWKDGKIFSNFAKRCIIEKKDRSEKSSVA